MDDDNKIRELNFTGNWFIDAGILGFVNLMEEVYGWDLNKLQNRIKTEPEIVYYGYFPFAYFYIMAENKDDKLRNELLNFIEKNKNLGKDMFDDIWWGYIFNLFKEIWIKDKMRVAHTSTLYKKDKNRKIKQKYNDKKYCEFITKREAMINRLPVDEQSKKNIFGYIENNSSYNISNLREILCKHLKDNCENSNVEDIINITKQLKNYLESIFDNIKSLNNVPKEKRIFFRIPINAAGRFQFFVNYLFFNTSKGVLEQLEDFKNLLSGNVKYSEYLSNIDKTINKFLPSHKEFPNALYTKFQVKKLLKEMPHLFVYLLSFPIAFNYVSGVGNILFYSNDLEFTYYVNKQIKTYINNEKNKDTNILKLTWHAVVDTIINTNVKWSLTNMYIIKYKRIQNQDIIGVDYIGIPKLQANFLLDDIILGSINTTLIVESKSKIPIKYYLLDYFIKGIPLTPIIIKSFKYNLSNNINYSISTYITAVALDMIYDDRDDALFSDTFMLDKFQYQKKLHEIKDSIRKAHSFRISVANLTNDMNANLKKNYAFRILDLVNMNNKKVAINTMIRIIASLNKAKHEDDLRRFVGYLVDLLNYKSSRWKLFAVAFALGLVGGNKNE